MSELQEFEEMFIPDKVTTTRDIERLEELLLNASDEDTPEISIEECLADGMYMRVGYFPAGVIGTAAIHLSDFLNIMVSGKMIVASEQGNVTVQGFDFFKSYAGVKKAFYILEDTTFISIDRVDTDELQEDMKALYSVQGIQEYNRLLGGAS